MKEYKQFVNNLSENRVDRLFLNSDGERAVVVLVELIKIAQNVLRVFAGCLCDPIGNRPEYIEAISDFIERGGQVRILLNKYNEKEVKESNLYKRLSYYVSEGKDIGIKITESHPYLVRDPKKKEVHFTVSDEIAYRIETDIVERTAECNFNSPQISKGLVTYFDSVYSSEMSIVVDLNTLFNNDTE